MATEKKTTRTPKSRQVSLLNWMGTLLLCAIPGVNLIALLCFAIMGKSPSKRRFAVAMLLWIVIVLAAIVAVLLLLPDQAIDFADTLREMAKPTATPAIWS